MQSQTATRRASSIVAVVCVKAELQLRTFFDKKKGRTPSEKFRSKRRDRHRHRGFLFFSRSPGAPAPLRNSCRGSSNYQVRHKHTLSLFGRCAIVHIGFAARICHMLHANLGYWFDWRGDSVGHARYGAGAKQRKEGQTGCSGPRGTHEADGGKLRSTQCRSAHSFGRVIYCARGR